MTPRCATSGRNVDLDHFLKWSHQEYFLEGEWWPKRSKAVVSGTLQQNLLRSHYQRRQHQITWGPPSKNFPNPPLPLPDQMPLNSIHWLDIHWYRQSLVSISHSQSGRREEWKGSPSWKIRLARCHDFCGCWGDQCFTCFTSVPSLSQDLLLSDCLPAQLMPLHC